MNAFTIFTVIVFVIVMVIVGPFLSITAINTLFPSAMIPFNFYTWIAMAWLHIVMASSTQGKS